VIEDPFDELKRSGPFWAGTRGKATIRFHQTQKFDEGCVSTAERYIVNLIFYLQILYFYIIIITPPKFNIAPEKWWLEDYFPFGKAFFRAMLNFRGVYLCWI